MQKSHDLIEIKEISGIKQPAGKPIAEISPDTLRQHFSPVPLLKAIRNNCLECCGGDRTVVKHCTSIQCNLWPYRMGTNPFRERKPLSEEQRSLRAENLRKAREKLPSRKPAN